MSKSFDIRYYQNDADEDNDCDDLPYPTSTSINFDYEFGDAVTWDVILWQFCKVLEATGYEGVRNKVRLIDPYGFMAQNYLFKCIGSDEDFEDWGDWDDTEEDKEETGEEEEIEIVCSKDADDNQKQAAKDLQSYVDSLNDAEKKDMIQYFKEEVKFQDIKREIA